jgi:hypothetical protein
MKVDVEGMECDVLAGAGETIRRCQPALYVENDRTDQSERLISLILGFGYRLWWYVTPMFNRNNFFRHPDDVFGNVWSINMLGLPQSSNVALPFAEVRGPQDGPRAMDGTPIQFRSPQGPQQGPTVR